LVSLGTEYQTKPDANQIKWANYALNLGADVVIGGHPHVVQKIVKEENNSSFIHGKLCIRTK
jgi:poly-gamma-glutamate capsule biosynthesis protein CapA/YwtB (metallophosphatase superfamily)